LLIPAKSPEEFKTPSDSIFKVARYMEQITERGEQLLNELDRNGK
jgi:hypothetical protein